MYIYTMLFICYSNLNIEYFSCNGIQIFQVCLRSYVSESESKSNFKFTFIFSSIDKSMFVLVLIVSKVFWRSDGSFVQ